MHVCCPNCRSREVFPSRLKSLLDLLLLAVVVRPYRCYHCAARFRLFTTPSQMRAISDRMAARVAMEQLTTR